MIKLLSVLNTPEGHCLIRHIRKNLKKKGVGVRCYGRGFTFRKEGWHNPPLRLARSIAVYIRISLDKETFLS